MQSRLVNLISHLYITRIRNCIFVKLKKREYEPFALYALYICFIMPFTCFLCSTNIPKTFSSKNSLSIHERTVHPNNKIIPHSHCLTSPSLYDIHHFKHSFIMQLKARLQFHRSEPKVKTLKME